MIHILKIITGTDKYIITYKLDSRHAKIDLYCVPHGLKFKLGIKRVISNNKFVIIYNIYYNNITY